MQLDADYYAARLSAELEAMGKATDINARAAHEALAETYRQRLADCHGSATAEAVSPAAG